MEGAKMQLTIDYSCHEGRIKPLHGVNNCPVRFNDRNIPEFAEAGIPFVRTHDSGGAYGRNILIDIPNIFRNFAADPADPAAYDFAFTDVYLRNLVNSGCRIFYRLGVTIENFHRIKAYRTAPPEDFNKWARICEGIIRHYNEGWAEGFHYQIEYWEIWNEPENPPMWSGSMEQYFELYSVTAKYLKQRFPSIKVGGYASCGFYSVTREGTSEFYQGFLRWFDAFLADVKKKNAPLDFFSWHLYTSDVNEVIAHAEYVEGKLKAAGFGRTENIFNEWNFIDPSCRGFDVYDAMKEIPAALFVAEAFCRMQDSPIDKAMYYDAEPTRAYCGLFYFPSQRVTPTYHAFRMFNELYRRADRISLSCKKRRKQLSFLAAADAESICILFVNRAKNERRIELELAVELKDAVVTLLDRSHDFQEKRSLLHQRTLRLPGESVLLLTIPLREKASPAGGGNAPETTQVSGKSNFAGLDG